MSQVIDVCEDSDDNEERPNSASSFQSILLSGKRAWDKTVESSKGIPPRNWNGPEKKNATGSAEFCVDLKLADEVEESPQKKRRGAVSSIPSSKNDAEGKCAQILLGVEATEQDVGSEDTQVPYHSEYHEGIPAAASQPMNSDSKQTSRDDGSPIKHSKKLSASKPSSNTSGRQYRVSAWEDRFTELADYRKIHGRCSVPQKYSENPKLATWVTAQKNHYRLHVDGKISPMTTFRIQALESLGFEWGSHSAAWEDRLRELADYRKIHGHCNIPQNCSENTKLAQWVKTQRKEYRLQAEGKISHTTLCRVQELDSLDFEWDIHGTVWKDRLSELADYRRIQGHCNVPQRDSENSKLATWVKTQKKQYRLFLDGKKSQMTLHRMQELESLGFEWKPPISRKKGKPKKPYLDDESRPVNKKPTNSRQGAISEQETAPSSEMLRITGYH
jgi:hypothetical protein